MLHLSARYFPREKLGVLITATSFRFRISLSNLKEEKKHGKSLPAERNALVSVKSHIRAVTFGDLQEETATSSDSN